MSSSNFSTALHTPALYKNAELNIQEDVVLYKGPVYSLVQIAPSNSKPFIEFYLSNYRKVHAALGTYSATEENIRNVYADNEIHAANSIYLLLTKKDKPLATLKGTKRGKVPFRTETEFGFDAITYLKNPSLDELSIWHHSKTSLDKALLPVDERHKIKDFLKVLYYILFQTLLEDDCRLLLGEVNDLNYISMKANGIDMEIVTKPVKTIGMPAYGITISRKSIEQFLNSCSLQSVLTLLD